MYCLYVFLPQCSWVLHQYPFFCESSMIRMHSVSIPMRLKYAASYSFVWASVGSCMPGRSSTGPIVGHNKPCHPRALKRTPLTRIRERITCCFPFSIHVSLIGSAPSTFRSFFVDGEHIVLGGTKWGENGLVDFLVWLGCWSANSCSAFCHGIKSISL